MLVKKEDPIRYYIINKRCLLGILKRKGRSNIIMTRPTKWKVFIRGLLRLDEELAFVRLPDALVKDFIAGEVIGRELDDGRIKINQHHPIKIEPWTFFNVCKFCAESFQYGTFQRFWEWVW